MWLFLALFACGAEKGEDSGAYVEGPDLEVSVMWMAEGVEVEVVSGPADLIMGVAQTAMCEGEECVTLNSCAYEWGDYGTFCHAVDSGSAEWGYGGDWTHLGAAEVSGFLSPFDLDGYPYSELVTYYAQDADTGTCWAWGDDPSFYPDCYPL